MNHQCGNIYVVKGASVTPVMLVRCGVNSVVAISMSPDLNRAVTSDPVFVKKPHDITEEELSRVFREYPWEYAGRFPQFLVNKEGEIECIKS